MRAVAPVVLGPLLPTDGTARDASLAAAMATLDDYLAHLSLPLQRQARALLDVLALLPVRWLLLRSRVRWREATPERVEAFLRRAQQSRLFLLRRAYDFLQSMTVLAWFDLPVAWADIGYPGPPVERPAREGESW